MAQCPVPDVEPHSTLIAELRRDKAYLQEALDRSLAQLAAERERSDVLMREALGRIEAPTAGEPRQDAPVSAQEAPPWGSAGDVDPAGGGASGDH